MRRSAVSQRTDLMAAPWPQGVERAPLAPPLVPDMAD